MAASGPCGPQLTGRSRATIWLHRCPGSNSQTAQEGQQRHPIVTPLTATAPARCAATLLAWTQTRASSNGGRSPKRYILCHRPLSLPPTTWSCCCGCRVAAPCCVALPTETPHRILLTTQRSPTGLWRASWTPCDAARTESAAPCAARAADVSAVAARSSQQTVRALVTRADGSGSRHRRRWEAGARSGRLRTARSRARGRSRPRRWPTASRTRCPRRRRDGQDDFEGAVVQDELEQVGAGLPRRTARSWADSAALSSVSGADGSCANLGTRSPVSGGAPTAAGPGRGRSARDRARAMAARPG